MELTRGPRRGVGRLEAFSDAVLAIVLTLLVLELLPDGAQSPEQLLESWPTYLAFLAAFLTIGIIWLNHNEQIARVRSADPLVLVLNLGVLLGATLVPWPTALLSAALEEDDHTAQLAAMVVFALVAAIISVPWVVLDVYLARHPRLLLSPQDVPWMRRHSLYSAGTLVIAVVSVVVALLSPLAALSLYVIIAAAFLLARVLERAPSEPADDAA